MKLTKGVITKEEAAVLAPDYVKYHDSLRGKGELPPEYHKLSEKVWKACDGLKRGQEVVTCNDGTWVRARVTSSRHTWRSEDSNEVRVGNGEWTWRVDGNEYAWPIKKG